MQLVKLRRLTAVFVIGLIGCSEQQPAIQGDTIFVNGNLILAAGNNCQCNYSGQIDVQA